MSDDQQKVIVSDFAFSSSSPHCVLKYLPSFVFISLSDGGGLLRGILIETEFENVASSVSVLKICVA